MMMIVSSALLVNEGSQTSLAKRKDLWNYLKNKNKKTYYIITHTKMGFPLQMKSKSGRKVIVWCYHFFNRIYGFN